MIMMAPSRNDRALDNDAAKRQPQLIRPHPLKAVAEIQSCQNQHKFQVECIEAGFPASAVEHAIQKASEWHRRWVLQEEEGHTMPHDDDQWSDVIEDFRLGAKNPSLSDGEVSPEAQVHVEEQRAPLIRPIALRIRDFAPSPLILSEELEEEIEPQAESPLTLPSEHYGPVVFDDLSFESLTSSIPSVILPETQPTLDFAKEKLLHALAISGGDVETDSFEAALLPLLRYYEETGWDARDPSGIYSNYANTHKVEGMWLTLSKPTYFGNLGETSAGDPMYTLGRMAFDMFVPTQLVCSLQGNFNPVHVVPPEERACLTEKCPKSLAEEIGNGGTVLREYNIVTAFTIEPNLADYPNAPNKDVRRPIKGIMTTYGYVLPDPAVPNRLSIWFTGGRIVPNDDRNDQREWMRLFKRDIPKRNLGENMRLLAASLLMGAEAPSSMNEDGSMDFEFTRPLGGHGIAYVDIIYLDDSLRLVRGHRGTIFAFARIPDNA